MRSMRPAVIACLLWIGLLLPAGAKLPLCGVGKDVPYIVAATPEGVRQHRDRPGRQGWDAALLPVQTQHRSDWVTAPLPES